MEPLDPALYRDIVRRALEEDVRDGDVTTLATVAPDVNPLLDTQGLVTEQWQPRGLPATFLVDPQGTIRKVFLKVDPNPHSKEVLEALADLQKK